MDVSQREREADEKFPPRFVDERRERRRRRRRRKKEIPNFSMQKSFFRAKERGIFNLLILSLDSLTTAITRPDVSISPPPPSSLLLFLATWFLSIGGQHGRCGAKTKGRTGEETRDPRGATSASGSDLKNRVNLRIRLGGCASITPRSSLRVVSSSSSSSSLVQIHLPLKRVPKSFQPASFFIAHTTANLPTHTFLLSLGSVLLNRVWSIDRKREYDLVSN